MSQIVFFGSSPPMTGRPLGMYRLAAHLRQQGFSAKCLWIWDNVTESIWYKIMQQHVNSGTLVVAVSATVMFRDQADGQRNFFGISDQEFRSRCQAIKTWSPNCKIVVGGAQVQYSDRAWLKTFDCVDYFAMGQGESLLTYLMQSISQRQRPRLPDITKPYVVNDHSHPYQDFNESITLWHPEDAVRYREPLPLELARGCIFRCSFCSYDLTGKKPEDFVRQKKLVEQEILSNYQQFGTDTYYVSDDLLNESDYKIDILYDIAQSLPFRLHLSGYVRLDLVRRWPNAFKKLIDSGLNCAFFGIETVNDRSGRAVGKGLGRARTMEAINMISDLCDDQFLGHAGMILGLPHDTPDTCEEIFDWACQADVRKVIKNVSIQALGISTKHGSSDIDRNPADFGYSIIASEHHGRRLSTDLWSTKNYDSVQASRDAARTQQKFSATYPWAGICNPWRLPWAVWCGPYSKEVLWPHLVAGTDHGGMYQQWIEKTHINIHQKHREYVKMMHTNT